MTTHSPLRVLHVLGALNPGGVESWLLQVLRNIDRDRFQLDFLVHSEKPAAYDDEVRSLGARILPCPGPRRPWSYGPRFKRILQEFGPYDVIHSHVHDFSGYVLRLARQAGVPVRIAHSHSDTSHVERQAGLLRRRYLAVMKGWLRKHATVGLGCSRRAAESLWGPDWQSDPRWKLFYCGIDLTPFERASETDAVRAELGFPSEAFVVGHVGRFTPEKNHAFIVEVAAALVRRVPTSRLLLVGDGPLRAEIEQQATAARIRDKVVFTGMRRDVPRLMTSAMDALLFPSLFEGLPMSLLEAQAAGLPCVYSDAVDFDAVVIPELMQRQSLSDSVSVWVDALLSVRDKIGQRSPEKAREIVASCPFNIRLCVERLERLYAEEAGSAINRRRTAALAN